MDANEFYDCQTLKPTDVSRNVNADAALYGCLYRTSSLFHLSNYAC